ncbi:MAG: 2-hydroxyacid dehydrogenase [Verrucomicrobiia bacterium]
MSDKPKIFLTRPIPPASIELLKREAELTYNPDNRVLSRTELIAGMAGQDGLLCTLMDGIDGELLDTNPNLKIVANYAVGYNNIDVAAASARNIPVTNTPGVLTDSTADMAWALMFAIGRRLVEGDQLVRSRNWQGWGPLQIIGQDITGATLGLIGFGRIGKAMVQRAKGFEMKVVYWNRTRLSETEEAELGITYGSREEVLAQSDFVSLHVALTPDTTHLIGPTELAAMKSTAYLINTARGPVVDEKALVEALKSGSIGGAGLDVFEKEPILEPELYDLPNVVIQPHLGSATIGTRTKMGNMAAENCFAACCGERPPNLVNPEIYNE